MKIAWQELNAQGQWKVTTGSWSNWGDRNKNYQVASAIGLNIDRFKTPDNLPDFLHDPKAHEDLIGNMRLRGYGVVKYHGEEGVIWRWRVAFLKDATESEAGNAMMVALRGGFQGEGTEYEATCIAALKTLGLMVEGRNTDSYDDLI